VGELSHQLSLGFVGTEFEVELTCGGRYLPLKLAVSEFALKSDELARNPTVTTESTDGQPSFQYQYSPPIAFRSTRADLLEKCRSHIKLVVRHERNTPGSVSASSNMISKTILEAVSRYRRSSCHLSHVSCSYIMCFKLAKLALDRLIIRQGNDASSHIPFHGNDSDPHRYL
jgi:hypothetical protein